MEEVKMRATLPPFGRNLLLALVTLLCAGYMGCSKGPQQPSTVATPAPAATAEPSPSPQLTIVPETGTPTAVSEGVPGPGSPAPATGSGASTKPPGSAALAAPRDAS